MSSWTAIPFTRTCSFDIIEGRIASVTEYALDYCVCVCSYCNIIHAPSASFTSSYNEKSKSSCSRDLGSHGLGSWRFLYKIITVPTHSQRPCRSSAVRRWLPTEEAWVRVRAGCGICGGQSGTGAGFLRVLRFPMPIIPPISPLS
jgi:hypothetical protein